MRLTGCTFAVPVTATRTRTEVLTAGEVVLKEQRQVLFEYESGCSAVYDFMSDQYQQPDPPPTLRLRGTRGELDDRTVCWLNDKNLPERAELDVAGDPATGEVLGVAFQGRTLYAPPFGPAACPRTRRPLPKCCRGMARFIETGEELYPLADALEDAYTALLMASPAVTPGAGLDGPAGEGLAPAGTSAAPARAPGSDPHLTAQNLQFTAFPLPGPARCATLKLYRSRTGANKREECKRERTCKMLCPGPGGLAGAGRLRADPAAPAHPGRAAGGDERSPSGHRQ